VQTWLVIQGAITDAPRWEIFTSPWPVRSPLMWWSYFLAGWLARLHYPEISSWVVARRLALATGLGGVTIVLVTLRELDIVPPAVSALAGWLHIYCAVCLICALTCGRSFVPRPIRFLSDASYGIYLFHLFFMYEAQKLVPHADGTLQASALLVPWMAGVLGPVSLILLARVVLGRHSRTLLGA